MSAKISVNYRNCFLEFPLNGVYVNTLFERDGAVTAAPNDYTAKLVRALPEDPELVYGENISANVCFKLVGNKPYKVTCVDTDPPYVDGITLETKTASQSGLVATIKGNVYTSTSVPDGTLLYLSSTGAITKTAPTTSGQWKVIVGYTIDATHFIFASYPPIKIS